MYQEEIKIPKERLAILIGKKGTIKKDIEKKTKTKLEINTKDNLVIIKCEDTLKIYFTVPVVRAIARGFNPEIAELLLDENYNFEIIDIKYFSGKSKKKLIRLKSRCIGKEGKARKNIETMTNTHVVIYGKTIGIIGEHENCTLAKKAIEYLLEGAPHGNVYKFIEKQKRRFNI